MAGEGGGCGGGVAMLVFSVGADNGVVVMVVKALVWCLSDMWWCVLQLEQEKTLGICQLSLGSKTGSQQRRYFRDNRFKRFKEAITDFRGFNSISPGETWAFYLGARRSSLTSRFLTSPLAPPIPSFTP